MEECQKVKSSHDNSKKVKFRCDSAGVVLKVLKARGWSQVGEEDETWNLFWCEVGQLKEAMDNKRLNPQQKIPHFRNHFQITRKNLLAKNMKRLKKQLAREGRTEDAALCDCVPVTFELPSEYMMFVEEYRKEPEASWIVKPSGGSQGKGIFLFKKLKDLSDWRASRFAPDVGGSWSSKQADLEQSPQDTHIVQRYIDDPYLLARRKFDMRIYVLVTSFYPLKIWLYREGFARISGANYSLNDMDDHKVHLTNVSVQLKEREKGEENNRCKWNLRSVRQYLTARHGSDVVEQLMQKITRLIICSLQSVQPVIMNDKHCFELYGYDILLDMKLCPWLLEVNASPSLHPTDKADYRLKYGLLEDVMNILDLEGRLSGKERRVGGFDLIWDEGPVWAVCPGTVECGTFDILPQYTNRFNSFLGCLNDREDQWKELLKQRKQSSKILIRSNEQTI